ncbi:type II secretion system GspH family protein [Methylobacillus arboreus]|uniref:type II secretion system protein n=1 Tax=Methylobacillus arboreus TaxID=755170 RepID=UPI001E571D72|nr:type II secretion system protein [Methylobacillus arboreus]MCB5189327.1 type II secretion system GspH family protein [Methylobacillus arboreus]
MKKQLAGFTLIELMVALVLLALILSSAAPVMQITAKRAKEQELKRNLWQLRDAIDAYKKAADDGLIKKSPGESGYPPNLQILVQGVENPRDPKKRKIHFLRSIPRDPFAPDTELPNDATWGKRSYASSFEEPAEGEDVYDVYSLSGDTGLNQQPYREW